MTRKIGLHHFAFYRGWIQALDIRDLGDRYLETGMDVRRARKTLKWLQNAFAAASIRNGRHGIGRLLRLAIAAPTSSPDDAPSLNEFRDELPDGFWTEKEVISAYLDRYPAQADARLRKRQELIRKQLDALKWIEGLVACSPVPDDLVSAWFDESVSNKLILANIPTIGALTSLIVERGSRWWASVSKLGERGAARIVVWLQKYEATVGYIPEYVFIHDRKRAASMQLALRPAGAGILPLTAFAAPVGLDGREGRNRVPGRPHIDADTDMAAISAWLGTKSPGVNTQASYRSASERFLLWAVIERGKALSDLSVEDCAAYRDWLSMLGRTPETEWTFRIPQAEWIQASKVSGRHKQGWRPFVRPLSPASILHSIGILSGLHDWLVQVGYLAFNPWAAVSRKLSKDIQDVSHATVEMSRALTVRQWEFLLAHIEAMPRLWGRDRVGYSVRFAYVTGMRRNELVRARVSHLYSMPLSSGDGMRWMLKVMGKGGRVRSVPMPDAMMRELSGYMVSRGLGGDLEKMPGETPLIADHTGQNPISDSMLYKALKEAFVSAADALDVAGRQYEAKAFRRASTHWLRHTRGSHLGQGGKATPSQIQQLLGHASVATTSIYMHSDEEALWDLMSEQ